MENLVPSSNIYKKATKKTIRFKSSKGLIPVEQLWNLSLAELDNIAIELKNSLGGNESFLSEKKKDSDNTQLKFDIVLDVLRTKQNEQEKAAKAKQTKERNQLILSIIERKQQNDLESKTIEDLEKMLEE